MLTPEQDQVVAFTKYLVPEYEYVESNPLVAIQSGIGNCATRAFILTHTLRQLGEEPIFVYSAKHAKPVSPYDAKSIKALKMDSANILDNLLMGHAKVLLPDQKLALELGKSGESIDPKPLLIGDVMQQRFKLFEDPLLAIQTYCLQHPNSFTSVRDTESAVSALDELIAINF